jgi:Zn-dependent protease
MAEKSKKYTSFHEMSPREYMYFPKGTIQMSKPGKFSRLEIKHLLISICVLTIAFTLLITRNNLLYASLYGFHINYLTIGLAMSFLGVLTAFFFHEISHKLMAQKYGLWAEYRMYTQGLKLALILGVFTPFVFAAPGAVMFMGNARNFETGKIAMAGPLANIIIASITFPLYLILFETTIGQIVGFICLINAFLATFNLLPFGPLDGVKIIRWNATIWVIMLIVAIINLMLILPRLTLSF